MQNKRTLAALLAGCCLLTAGYTGCSKNIEHSASVESKTVVTTAPAVTTVPAETVPPRDRTEIDTEKTHVVDDAKALSAAQIEAINSYAAWLSKTFDLHACVVTASTMDGKTPEKYAADYYKYLYNEGESGCLLLINNDTGTDFIYTPGTCGLYFTAERKQMTLARIAKLLATKDYEAAVKCVFEQVELSCPEHLFDRTGTVSAAEGNAIEALGDKVAQSTEAGICLILAAEADNETAEALRKAVYGDKDSIVLLVARRNVNDPASKNVIAAALGGSLKESVGNTALGAALDKIDAALNESLTAGAEKFYDAAAGFVKPQN